MSNFETYQHFKGGLYVKLCESEHTETGENLVTYVCATSGKIFSRPKDMFYDTVNKDNYYGPRFRKIPDTLTKSECKNVRII